MAEAEVLRFPLQVGPAVVAWVVLRCQAVAAAPGGDCRPQAVEEEASPCCVIL